MEAAAAPREDAAGAVEQEPLGALTPLKAALAAGGRGRHTCAGVLTGAGTQLVVALGGAGESCEREGRNKGGQWGQRGYWGIIWGGQVFPGINTIPSLGWVVPWGSHLGTLGEPS